MRVPPAGRSFGSVFISWTRFGYALHANPNFFRCNLRPLCLLRRRFNPVQALLLMRELFVDSLHTLNVFTATNCHTFGFQNLCWVIRTPEGTHHEDWTDEKTHHLISFMERNHALHHRLFSITDNSIELFDDVERYLSVSKKFLYEAIWWAC